MKKCMETPGKSALLTREIELGLKLRSPFLVPTYDTFVEDCEQFNIMPFLENGNLQMALRSFRDGNIQEREDV
jgi:hypothetical protein